LCPFAIVSFRNIDACARKSDPFILLLFSPLFFFFFEFFEIFDTFLSRTGGTLEKEKQGGKN